MKSSLRFVSEAQQKVMPLDAAWVQCVDYEAVNEK